MWNTFLDWFLFIVDKIKNWKDVWRTLFILLIVFALNIITKEYTERLVINSKTEVVNEINQRHDSILNHVIEKSPEVDRVINSVLDNLNITYGFNRASLMIYHDNITMTNGMPYLRMSISHERIREIKMKVTAKKTEMQNVPSSMYSDLNAELLKHGQVIRTLKSLETIDKNSYTRCLNENIKGYIVILIRNTDNSPLAALWCFSCDNEVPMESNVVHDLIGQGHIIRDVLKY